MSFKDIKKGILKMVLGEEASTTIEKNEKTKKNWKTCTLRVRNWSTRFILKRLVSSMT